MLSKLSSRILSLFRPLRTGLVFEVIDPQPGMIHFFITSKTPDGRISLVTLRGVVIAEGKPDDIMLTLVRDVIDGKLRIHSYVDEVIMSQCDGESVLTIHMSDTPKTVEDIMENNKSNEMFEL